MIWKLKNSIGQGRNQLLHPIEHVHEINLEPHNNISFRTNNVIPFAREHATNDTWRLQLQDCLKKKPHVKKSQPHYIGIPSGERKKKKKSTSH